MKNILIALLLSPVWVFAQTEKGITPLASPPPTGGGRGEARAVVIGISDYQDPAIPDLRFADRDAEAFADWLRSPAGGSLPESSIHLLLNKDATTGKIIAALDGLISVSKPGDVAMIYFSGHGDVERVTKFQRGYFLTWDSPPTVYAAGAFSLVFLQDIISTLSEAGVQVVVVSDACRAGKLAGSEFGGAQATSAALAKQFANEIKILSCQPEEFSLEGEQWGGGRGAFSYHLVDALYGLADGNSDGTVSLLELGRYLEEKVPGETAPHSQIPFTVGSKAASVATVDAGMLASWREKKEGQTLSFAKIEGKGLEDLALANADSSIREMYAAFSAAIERGDLMPTDSTAGKSANDYYELLIKEPALTDLHGLMTRNFAAALMDEGQQFINLLMKTDPQLIDEMISININYGRMADYTHQAANLLGPKHYIYNSLKAKEYYFKVATFNPKVPSDSLASFKKQTLLIGLGHDNEAPYLISALLETYKLDSFRVMAGRLEELAPRWVWGLNLIAEGYGSRGRFDIGIVFYKKILAIDSSFTPAYGGLDWLSAAMGAWPDAVKWQNLLVQQMQKKIAADTPPKFAFEYYTLGLTLWRLRRYENAISVFKEGNRISGDKSRLIHRFLTPVYVDLGRFEDALLECVKLKELGDENFSFNFTGIISHYYLNDVQHGETAFQHALANGKLDAEDYYIIACTYIHRKQLERADSLILAGLVKFPEDITLLFGSAELQRQMGQLQHIKETCLKILTLTELLFRGHDYYASPLLYHLLALDRLGRQEEVPPIIHQATEILSEDAWFHFNLSCFYSMTGVPKEAFAQLEKAEELGWEPNPAIIIYGTVKDPLLDPLRHLPEFQAWEKRWSPPYKDYSKE